MNLHNLKGLLEEALANIAQFHEEEAKGFSYGKETIIGKIETIHVSDYSGEAHDALSDFISVLDDMIKFEDEGFE